MVAILGFATGRLCGGEIASARLDIVGLSLEIVPSVVTGIDIPVSVQTTFGGKTEDAAAVVDMTAAGDLIGPGLDASLHLVTAPGHKFSIPPLHQQGDYVLQNVRLLDRDGRLVQVAVPSSVSIRVAGVLDAGACPSEPTTVIDLTLMGAGGEAVVVRVGRGVLAALGL